MIVEDERAMREMLALALEREGYEVRAFASGLGADSVVRDWPADLIILDIVLPGADGFHVLQRLRAVADVPVLMLTARTETVDKLRAFGGGADDYVTKPFDLDELLARVAAALRRPAIASATTLRFADLSLDAHTRVVIRAERMVDLTPREFALLEMLVRTPGRAFGKEELLTNVWGYEYEGDGAIVDRYISYVRAKLEAGGEERLIQTVRGIGYALRRAGA